MPLARVVGDDALPPPGYGTYFAPHDGGRRLRTPCPGSAGCRRWPRAEIRDMSREELLRLEVSELTEMLRADDCFIPLRQLLLEAGLEPDSLFMAGFIENAAGVVPGGDDVTIGVVVTAAGEVYEYEGRIFRPPLDEVRLVRRSAEAAATDWPALNAALAYEQ